MGAFSVALISSPASQTAVRIRAITLGGREEGAARGFICHSGW